VPRMMTLRSTGITGDRDLPSGAFAADLDGAPVVVAWAAAMVGEFSDVVETVGKAEAVEALLPGIVYTLERDEERALSAVEAGDA
jgi:hypothetical protein